MFPTLFFFVIIAHDVVLFVIRGSTIKKYGVLFPDKKAWGSVSPEDKSECELALIKYLNKKLDHAAHRKTFDRKFADYRGDVLGATLHDMVEKGILVEISDRRYKLR